MGACLSCLLPSSSPPVNHEHRNPVSYAAALVSGVASDVAADLGVGSGGDTASDALEPPRKQPVAIHRGALVTRMPDGDTFTAELRDGESVRVRVFAIDCPETKQNFGVEAGNIGRALINNKRVTLAVQTTDRYGRLVAEVIMGNGRCFGREMLRRGAAWHYSDYDKREELEELMSKAKEEKVGLWAYPRPQRPWVYRKGQRNEN